MIELQSTIACPACGHRSTETMPTDACQYLYACKQCGLQMKPKKGDCCVFGSYGDIACSPMPPFFLKGSCCQVVVFEMLQPRRFRLKNVIPADLR
jgi:hypothetical protein